jgi:valyl-tRNA synthetase
VNTAPQHNEVSIIVASPNPTGSLHLGHALNLTVQDVFARWYRSHGVRVYWEATTDHGGSSTEMVMHLSLKEQSKIPRDVPDSAKRALLESLTKQNVCTIARQFQDLKLTLDATALRSIGDEDVQNEYDDYVRTLYNKGYLYGAKKIDDWCYERGQSIPSYDSVSQKSPAQIYTLKYSLGDFTVTVDHTELAYLVDEVGLLVPAGSDLASFEGTYAKNPLGKRVAVYAADVSSPQSLIPAYDAASLQFCLNRKLEIPCSIDHHGHLRAGMFKDQDFRAARNDLLAIIRKRGSLLASMEQLEDVRSCRGTGYRVYRRVVPGLFIRSSILLQNAIDTISSGMLSIYPKRYQAYMLNWMKDLVNRGDEADWKLTREHLCGNRVPSDVIRQAFQIPAGDPIPDYRMDLMISCALWTYAANGIYCVNKRGPISTQVDTSIFVTGLDLLFFMVASSIALSSGIGVAVPFSDVIVHPLITDQFGQKMSKSMRNTVEVDDIIQQFGTPALRLYLLSRLDDTKDFLSVDLAGIASLSKQLEAMKSNGSTAHSNAPHVSVEEINEDLNRLENSLSERDLGSAARLLSSLVSSFPRWPALPDDVRRRVREISEVFLTEPFMI